VATYSTWRKSQTVRRLTWVCGTEACLAAEVVAAHRAGADPSQLATFWAGETPERDIWDTLLSYAPPGGRRAVVYGAERLKYPDTIADLAAAQGMDAAVTVFVSGEGDFTKEGGGLAPHLEVLKAARDGQLVRCCAPSSFEAKAALLAVWWPGMAQTTAYDVLARCGSLQAAWQACRQGNAAGLEPSPAYAVLVCPAAPGGDLADLLIAGEKQRAMVLAAQLSRGEVGALIGLLDYRLTAAAEIRAEQRDGGEEGRPRYGMGKIARHAQAYDPARVLRLRGVLAGIDSAWRSGAAVGLAESIVARW
jgi:hypothetical protein